MRPTKASPCLSDLAAKRKACRICVDREPELLKQAADFPFDPDVVSHWAQWLGHPRPRLLIVGQDFSDAGYFERHQGADDPANPTNRNLHRLLTAAGFSPATPGVADLVTPVYLTNSILCLKQPPMNRPIAGRWVRACAENHLRPLIECLQPEAVVGMGAHGWRATRIALGLDKAPASIGTAAGGIWKTVERHVCAIGHCGPLGLANRSWARQIEDWRRIGMAFGNRVTEVG